jgi:hypothetical protein
MPAYFDSTRQRFRVEISRISRTGARVRRTKLMPRNATREEAEAVAAKWEKDLLIRDALTTPDSAWPAYVDTIAADKASWLNKSMAQLRSRSKKKGFECGMQIQDLKALLLRCGGRCEVTGMRLHTKWEGKRHPMAPSIDRIDSSIGYMRGNCRVVCYAVNIAMLHWGEEMFGQIATGWVLNKYTVLALAHTLDI